MKQLSTYGLAWSVVFLVMVSGCELVTNGPPKSRVPSHGPDLVINEVFSISPDKYYSYSWLELYNPSPKPVPWFQLTYPSQGFAVSASGDILRTNDDGVHWNSILAGSGTRLNSITVPYRDTCYVAGDGGLLTKVYFDTSETPHLIPLTTNTTQTINSIVFAPQARIGFFVGDNGVVMRTINGGSTWTSQIVHPATTKNFHNIFFINFLEYAVGDSGLITKRSTGITFEQQTTVPVNYQQTNFYGVFFAADTGWVVGANGTILHTTNGGLVWRPDTSHVTTTLRCGFTNDQSDFYKLGRAWAAGDNGVVLRTDDNGRHWDRRPTPTTERINSISFTDSMHGWAMADNGVIIASTDGGLSWRLQNSTLTENLLSTAFIFPPTTANASVYQITTIAQKKHFFFDPFFGPNYDFITSIDTGIVHILVLGRNSVPVQGFTIIDTDSLKFKDHFALGPGQTDIINFSLAFDTLIFVPPNISRFYVLPINPTLWNLLPSSEIKLEKISFRFIQGTNKLLSQSVIVLDDLRYGGYRPVPDAYPNNDPLGFLPEGWSFARYSDDVGGEPLNKMSSTKTFYLERDPIPGWYSQTSKPQ